MFRHARHSWGVLAVPSKLSRLYGNPPSLTSRPFALQRALLWSFPRRINGVMLLVYAIASWREFEIRCRNGRLDFFPGYSSDDQIRTIWGSAWTMFHRLAGLDVSKKHSIFCKLLIQVFNAMCSAVYRRGPRSAFECSFMKSGKGLDWFVQNDHLYLFDIGDTYASSLVQVWTGVVRIRLECRLRQVKRSSITWWSHVWVDATWLRHCGKHPSPYLSDVASRLGKMPVGEKNLFGYVSKIWTNSMRYGTIACSSLAQFSDGWSLVRCRLTEYDYKTSFFGDGAPLSQAVGYPLVIGVAAGFVLFTVALFWLDRRYAGTE